MSKGSLGEMVKETVDGEAVGLEEEEEEEELFSEKPTPLWATFDPNEVLLDNSHHFIFKFAKVRTDREIFFVALNGLLSPR